MSKQLIVNALIEKSTSPFDEGDREYLEGLSGTKLTAIAVQNGIKNSGAGDTIDDDGDDNGETLEDAAAQIAPKKQKGAKFTSAKNKKKADAADDDEAEQDGKGAPVANQEPLTMEEYIDNAPEGIRDVLVNGVRAHNSAKAKLIGAITANRANVFTKDQLAAKPLQELQGLAALATSAAPAAERQPSRQRAITANNYGGLGDVGGGEYENNSADYEEEEALEVPVMNFSRRDAEDEE